MHCSIPSSTLAAGGEAVGRTDPPLELSDHSCGCDMGEGGIKQGQGPGV